MRLSNFTLSLLFTVLAVHAQHVHGHSPTAYEMWYEAGKDHYILSLRSKSLARKVPVFLLLN